MTKELLKKIGYDVATTYGATLLSAKQTSIGCVFVCEDFDGKFVAELKNDDIKNYMTMSGIKGE